VCSARLAPDACRPFAGIRFVQPDDASAVLPLPSGGLGVRRTALVEAMARRAKSLGAVIADRTPVGGVERTAAGAVIHTAHGDVHARLVVAADGLHSPLRRAAGLNLTPSARRRFAIRQHFAVRPWTDCVEVHVDDLGEAVMTPVGENAVNVNVVWDAATMEPPAFDTLGDRFPALHARLAGATLLSTLRGAGPMERLATRRHRRTHAPDRRRRRLHRLDRRRRPVDGLQRGAGAPRDAARDPRGRRDGRESRRLRARRATLFRGYRVVTRTLLWIAHHPAIRRRLIRYLAHHQAVGDAMMSGAMRLMLANVPGLTWRGRIRCSRPSTSTSISARGAPSTASV
jgi:hypothetical protein